MKKDSLIKSTTLCGLATFMSRILGLIRDSVLAACIPGAWQDIFWAGFKIPSTFRMLFAEGSLSAVFIPMLTRVREREGEEKAKYLASVVFNFLCTMLVVVVIIATILAPYYVPFLLDFPKNEKVVALNPADIGLAGFMPNETDWRIPAGVRATQIMFPFLFFIALAAWAMGVLYTHRYFFMPSLASAFFNMSVIAGAIIAPMYFKDMNLIFCLGISIVIGGLFQFGVQLPQAVKIGYFPPKMVFPFDPMIKDFLLKILPGIFGLAVYQIDALVTGMYFASKYGEGGIANLTYAFRFIQFPLGIIGVALASASFPQIAQFIEQGRSKEAVRTLTDVIKYLLLLMIPATVGLAILGHDIVRVVYDRGEFHRKEWLEPTYMALMFYSFGLFFYSLTKVLVQFIQAHHDFRRPVYYGLVNFLTNVTLCIIFTHYLPLWSLALASAIASIVQCGFLMTDSVRRAKEFSFAPILLFGGKVLIAAAVMGGMCYFYLLVIPLAPTSFHNNVIRVLLGVGVGLFSYAFAGWFMFRNEIQRVLRMKQA